LGVDPSKANQMVRGIVTLPHGTGKTIKVLVFVLPTKKKKQKLQVLIMLDSMSMSLNQQGWTDMDVVITMPA
jgi:large subunit ribosomal protein L1